MRGSVLILSFSALLSAMSAALWLSSDTGYSKAWALMFAAVAVINFIDAVKDNKNRNA